MGRFRKGDPVRINLIGKVGLRYSLGNLDIELPRPDKWGATQTVLVHESNLIRSKHGRSFVGCQECLRWDIRQWADQPGRIRGGLYGVTVTSRDDCISAHGDTCEDDSGLKKRRDPDDMDEAPEPEEADE